MGNILLTASIVIITLGYVVLCSRIANISFPFSKETHISCDTNTHITIMNTGVLDEMQCWINNIDDIKNSCDGKHSCTFTTNTTSDCLFQYGYINVSYICRGVNYGCNFESGLCGWSQDDSDNFDWTVLEAKTELYSSVPKTDHTTGSQFGHLLHSGKWVYNNKPYDNQKARLTSNIIVSKNVMCLTFWYQMYGTWTKRGLQTSTLNIYQQTRNQLGTAVGTLSSQTGTIWLRKEIELKNLPSFRLVLESVQGGDASSIIVDDVSIRDGNCSGSQFDCTFEDNGYCGWNVESEGLTWFNKMTYDHTKGSGDGHCLIASVNTQQRVTTKLLRNAYPLIQDTCLTFWYYIALSDSGFLRVALRLNNTYNKILWTTSSGTSQQWSPAIVDINASEINNVSYIVIECTSNQTTGNTFAIDDISMITGKCSGDKTYERRYNNTLDIFLIDDCPKQFLDAKNFSFNYYPQYVECEDVYKQAQMLVMESCSNFNVSDPEYCNISLSAIKDKNRHCFVLPENISFNYTCEVSAANSIGKLNQEDSFTIIGIGVGAGAALLVLIIIIVCFVKRRTRLVNKKKQKTNKPKQGSSDVNDATSGKHGRVKDGDLEAVYYNEQYREEGNSNFMKMSNLMDGVDNSIHSDTTEESSNDIVYYNLDIKVKKKMSNKSKPDIHRPEIDKMIDFNSGNNEDEYDRTNSIRLKREEDNVYSHAVDDVYDTASQTRNPIREEDVSYDHFVGGTSESNYSVVHKKTKK